MKPVGIILSCPVSLAYRFVVVVADIVGVRDKEEAISPFLVLFQALEDWSREDGFVLQRVLWEITYFN